MARVAGALAARGVRPGDRVAMLLHNGLEFPETLLACFRLGAIAVPINFRLTQSEIDYIRRRLPAPPCSSTGRSTTSPRPRPPSSQSDPALLCYTSGTTGRPKGAVLTHANLVASTRSWIHEMGATADDVWLSGQPLFHIGGINGMLPFLALGAKAVITPTTGFDPTNAVRLMEEHAVTMCIFVPTQWDQVTAIPQRTRLRTAMWGAAPASRKTLEALARTYPGVDIVSAYGQTEMSGATTLLKGPDATRKMGSVGKPMRDVELRLEDEVDGVGEIVYRGPFVMQRLLERRRCHRRGVRRRLVPQRRPRHPRRGGLSAARGPQEGHDRQRRREHLSRRGRARAARAPGGRRRRRGRRPAPALGRDAGGLRRRRRPPSTSSSSTAGAHLASYKKPTAIHFVTSLPRNAAGKVLKRELRP